MTARRALPDERRDRLFAATLTAIVLAYVAIVAAMLLADIATIRPSAIKAALASPAIRYAALLSLLTCTLAATLALLVAVPAGYLLSRRHGRLWRWIEALFDVPIVLPPLVVGLSLLVLFQTSAGRWVDGVVASLGLPGIDGVTFEVPAIVIAQFVVGAAFATRAMRATFDELSDRREAVAMTLGCTRGQAFVRVTLPEAKRGLLSAFTLAWARCLGEFGPVLVFAGTTRFKTEVLPTSIFLQLNIGDLQGALAVALLMVTLAAVVLGAARWAGRSW